MHCLVFGQSSRKSYTSLGVSPLGHSDLRMGGSRRGAGPWRTNMKEHSCAGHARVMPRVPKTSIGLRAECSAPPMTGRRSDGIFRCSDGRPLAARGLAAPWRRPASLPRGLVRADGDWRAQTDVLRARLDNGLRVVILRNRLAPVATTVVNYLVGANETPRGFPGMAHAQEHMMFRGSPGLSADQLASIGSILGGDFTPTPVRRPRSITIRCRPIASTSPCTSRRRGCATSSTARPIGTRSAAPSSRRWPRICPVRGTSCSRVCAPPCSRGRPMPTTAWARGPSFERTTGANAADLPRPLVRAQQRDPGGGRRTDRSPGDAGSHQGPVRDHPGPAPCRRARPFICGPSRPAASSWRAIFPTA